MILNSNSLSGRRPGSATLTALAVAGAMALTACGSSDGDDADEANADSSGGDLPSIVVTTNILGDVVIEVVGDQADVVAIMPVGADPHDFQASAQEIDRMMSADVLIVNGASFEEGLLDVIESAEDDGVVIYEAIDGVDALVFGEGGHSDEHDDEEHDDEEHDDEEHDDEEHDDEEHDDHAHGDVDPHFFTDPARMADAVDGIVEFLSSEVDGLDVDALAASGADYVAALQAVDEEVATLIDGIDERVLVTSHEVFAYFADRYGFEVVGVVVPSGSTSDTSSAAEIAELVEVLNDEGVETIFSDSSGSTEVVETLASEVDGASIVELYTESLGDADSDGAAYIDMIRTNAERISAALS